MARKVVKKVELSAPGWIIKNDWKKIGVGALVALAGALATYIVEISSSLDFGSLTPVAVAVASVLVNMLRKWIAVTEYK